jgi:hypothetical protein
MAMPRPRDARRPVSVVCVTGMHRCGTSFVASALRHLGVFLGDPEQLMRPGSDNPAGYYEIQAVTELNDELLAHLGGAWDQPPVLDPGWEHDAGLERFRDRASDILDETFGPPRDRPHPIAWKDPRLSLLLPFWRTVTPIEKTILLVRNPVEVAASLASRRYAVGGAQAASLWLRYVFAATANDPGHLLVRYRDLFDDLGSVVAAIAGHLDVPAPGAHVAAAAGAELDPDLRHHRACASSQDAKELIMAMAMAVWNGGGVDRDVVPPLVADGIARGWFRPPLDRELLTRARMEMTSLRATLRQQEASSPPG